MILVIIGCDKVGEQQDGRQGDVGDVREQVLEGRWSALAAPS